MFKLPARPALSTWLFVCVTATMVAVVLACALVIDRFVRDEARQQATRNLQIYADGLRDALDRGMAQHVSEVLVIARLDQVAHTRDPAAARRVLDEVRRSFPQFAWLGLTDARGTVTAAADGLLEGVDVSGRAWFSGGLRDSHVGDVHPAVLLARLLPAQAEPWRFVDIATPVRGPDGELRGVLGAHLSWGWAAQIKRELVDREVEQHHAEALVVAHDTTVLLGPPATQGRPLETLPDHLQAMSQTRGEGPYPGLGWSVVVRQPEAVAMAGFQALQRRIAGAALLLCLVLAPLMWLLARRLSAPLLALTAGLESGAAQAPLVQPLYREAEVLATALARHAQRQAEDATRLRQLNASLQERVAERTAALAESEQRLRDVADNVPALIAYFDAQERCRFANAGALRIQGLVAEQLPTLTLRDALGAVHYEEYRPHIRQALAGQRASFEGQIERAGKPIEFQTHFVPDLDSDGKVMGMYVLSYDQTALKAAERRLRTIADNLPALISYIDRHERLQFCNRTFHTWLGLDPAAIVGKPMREVMGDALYAPRREMLERALAGERCDFDLVSHALGVARHLHAIYLPDVSPEGTVEGVYALSIDVSAMKAAEEQLRQMARTDTLTGLPNRLSFNEKLAEALARSRRRGQPVALLFLDVDRFKSINDTQGHAAGDEVLKVFAQRLRASVRETDTVARLAGDEFVVVLEDFHTAEEPQFVARKIIAAIGRPFEWQGRSMSLSTSIGIAFHADGHVAPDQLLASADKALYDAKAERNTYRLASA